jgi:hypothetical protein
MPSAWKTSRTIYGKQQKSNKMENNESLGGVLSDLKKKGYEADLNFETETFALDGSDLDMRLHPEAFQVDEVDRVDDKLHPKEDAVVYAISSCTGVKGVVVDKQQDDQ